MSAYGHLGDPAWHAANPPRPPLASYEGASGLVHRLSPLADGRAACGAPLTWAAFTMAPVTCRGCARAYAR